MCSQSRVFFLSRTCADPAFQAYTRGWLMLFPSLARCARPGGWIVE